MTKSTADRMDANKAAFLKHFEGLGTVTAACQAAGISRETAYKYRKNDAAFADDWDAAEEACTEQLEREAYRRAFEGVERDIFQGGRKVGRERKFSDTLTIFLLKARRPDIYRERISIEDDRAARERAEAQQASDEELDRRLTGLPDGVSDLTAARNGKKVA